MRQRRGVNFMGNIYMDWEEKGKGFFKGRGLRDEGIRGLRNFQAPRGPGLAPSDLPPPILVSRSTMEWICASHGNWPPQTYPRLLVP
jgi:hypothetical protein